MPVFPDGAPADGRGRNSSWLCRVGVNPLISSGAASLGEELLHEKLVIWQPLLPQEFISRSANQQISTIGLRILSYPHEVVIFPSTRTPYTTLSSIPSKFLFKDSSPSRAPLIESSELFSSK